MWIPRDAAEVEEAARRGGLEETASFDAKADLPSTPRKNVTLAVDVAAMSTDGGTLLYGVAEDANKRPTVPQPITLAGAAERVDQIVSTSIAEVPYIDVREYPTDADASKGYLLVVVPQSPRAPHQVIVGNDLRFYSRGAKGNRMLNEGEVARLYRRREEWEQSGEALLAEAIAQAPFAAHEGLAYLHGFTRPVVPDRGIWDRAVARAGNREELQRLLAEAAGLAARASHDYAPRLRQPYWHQQGADEWRMSTRHEPQDDDDPRNVSSLVNVRINIDGRGHLFCGRAADTREHKIIFEVLIAGNFAGFVAAMGTLYRLGSYHGHVDVGLAVTGLRGGYSNTMLTSGRPFIFFEDSGSYNADTYPRNERVAAAELDDPRTVARRMLRHLFEATTGQEDFDPFA
jgi:hypothetical protein